MTRTNVRLIAGTALAFVLCRPSFAWCQTLGAAQNFGILGGGGAGAVTAAVGGVPSQISGDVGASEAGSSIIGFPPALGGVVLPPFTLHAPNDAGSIAAQASVTALFTALSSAGGPATAIPDQLAGQNLGPGVYSLGAANLASGGVLTLSGNGVYIFRVSSSLATISTSNINLIGAQACNIWWQVGSSATLGGVTFAGNVIAFTGVNSMGPNARLAGRLLTRAPGSVTMAGDNTVTISSCSFAAGTVGVTKAFSPAAILPGGVSTLTLTLFNANPTGATVTSPLVDTLPSGVVIAASPTASTTCGGGVSAIAGASSVTLAAGNTIPAGSCFLVVNVTSSTLGTYTNTLPAGALQTSNGNSTVPSTAILTVAAITPVPTLTQWATIVLAALLCLCGFVAMRHRRIAD